MIDTQSPPAPTDPLEHHADFLELSTLLSEDRRTSVYDYARDLRIGNADEAVADSENDGREDGLDDDTDESEPLADAAFSALDERRRCCGTGMYPFEVEDAAISTSVNAETTVYTFLALLSWFGGNAGPTRGLGHKLFEEVCARAAAEYLGGSANNAHWEVFGFPRRVKKTGFKDALDSLCTRLGEGDSHHRGRKTLPSQKDGKLDVVAWREFADKRRGKLIFFGQCATGSNWLSKVSELPDTAK